MNINSIIIITGFQSDKIENYMKELSEKYQVEFEVIYAVSDNKGRFRDISNAKKVVGYEPQDGIKEWPLTEWVGFTKKFPFFMIKRNILIGI